MENHFLIGTKNNGCFIDNNAHIIEYYERLNLPEKLSKKDPCTTIKYENITKIQVTYAISEGIGFGVITLHLIIETQDLQKHNFQILFMDTQREDLNKFIKLLFEANLTIIDEHDLLKTILQSNEKIYEIIEKIEKNR